MSQAASEEIELTNHSSTNRHSNSTRQSASPAASFKTARDARPRTDNDRKLKKLLRFQEKLEKSAADLMALWTPVTLSVLLASAMTLIRHFGESHASDPSHDRGELPYLEPEVDLNAERIINASSSKSFSKLHLVLITCLVAVVIIVVMSFVMVTLLKLNCFGCLKGYVCVAFVMLGCHLGVFWFYTAANALLVSVDWVTAMILIYNLLALITLCMAFGHAAPKRLIQAMHVLLSAAVAYIIANLLLGGNFLYASLLCGAFSLWDLFAVLCPRGPLNSLIRMAEGESRVTDFMQPLVYTAAVWTATAVVASKPTEKVRRGSRLGLGDFIFYGVLVATATKQCGPLGGLASYTALMAGFCLTLVGLRCLGRALPALPLPVASAVAAVGLMDSCGLAFSSALSERQLVL